MIFICFIILWLGKLVVRPFHTFISIPICSPTSSSRAKLAYLSTYGIERELCQALNVSTYKSLPYMFIASLEGFVQGPLATPAKRNAPRMPATLQGCLGDVLPYSLVEDGWQGDEKYSSQKLQVFGGGHTPVEHCFLQIHALLTQYRNGCRGILLYVVEHSEYVCAIFKEMVFMAQISFLRK